MNRVNEIKEIILSAIEEKNGIKTEVLDLRGKTGICDYFIITSGDSFTQVSAIADEIIYRLEKNEVEIINRSGYENAEWILIDCGDVVAHIFHKDEREYYNLERLWSAVNRKEEE